MAKDLESLLKSRKQRAEIMRLFGDIPQSIMKHNRNDKAIDPDAEKRCYTSTANVGNVKALQKDFHLSGQGAHRFRLDVSGHVTKDGTESGVLSRFPQNIGRAMVLLYTEKGDVVIDPFAGHNSRMELCWRLERSYMGCDASAKFHKSNCATRAKLLDEKKRDLFGKLSGVTIKLANQDSRSLPWPDECADFTITSPPYWDLEYYGDEKVQLGRSKTYREFMLALMEVMRENYRVLRPGSYCVWFVNDFRRNGKFYNYHGDTIAAMTHRSVGFVQHDILIVDFGPAIRAAFAQQIIDTKILPKKHEYGLIFKKPGKESDAKD